MTPVLNIRHKPPFDVEPASAHGEGQLSPSDSVVLAVFTPPSSLALRFGDGKQFDLPVSSIGIDSVDWTTAAASPSGETIVVRGLEGDEIPIDAPSLRYLADPEYARRIDEAIARLHTPKHELQEMLSSCEPPDEWYKEDQTGLLK